MKISVNIPSYHRCDDVLTLKYLPFGRVYVSGDEEDDYRKNYPEAKIIACSNGIQGNVSRVRNYILEKEFEAGNDVVVLVDDDLYRLERYVKMEGSDFGYIKEKVETDEFLLFVEKYSIMAEEIGAKFWGVNINSDPMAYRHACPFSTISPVLGPFQCFLKGNRCMYDESLPLKEDYDMTLQQLNLERVILRIDAYHYICRQSTNKGGCATYRNREREKQQMEALRQKWGSDIIRFDTSNKGKTKKKKLDDYNPIISIPIKGV
jgi:hypothetical protein